MRLYTDRDEERSLRETLLLFTEKTGLEKAVFTTGFVGFFLERTAKEDTNLMLKL